MAKVIPYSQQYRTRLYTRCMQYQGQWFLELQSGGTILQTARCEEMRTEEGQQKAAAILKKYGAKIIRQFVQQKFIGIHASVKLRRRFWAST
mgnify:CR=1 FL=1